MSLSFQHIQGKMPKHSSEKENLPVPTVVTTVNVTSGETIYSNSSHVMYLNSNSTSNVPEDEYEYWPHWVQQVTCVSHLAIAFNSSVNFFIYYIKRRSLNSGTVFNIIKL